MVPRLPIRTRLVHHCRRNRRHASNGDVLCEWEQCAFCSHLGTHTPFQPFIISSLLIPCPTTVDRHPSRLGRFERYLVIEILPTCPPRGPRACRRAQALRDQRHRFGEYTTKRGLHDPLLHQRRGSQLQTVLRRHLLRHPFDPHLRRNDVLLPLHLVRLQRQAL